MITTDIKNVDINYLVNHGHKIHFGGILDSLFFLVLKETCEKLARNSNNYYNTINGIYNSFNIYINPDINRKVYIMAAQYIQSNLKNNTIVNLFTDMIKKYSHDSFGVTYINECDSNEPIYRFCPKIKCINDKYYIFNALENLGDNNNANVLCIKSINGMDINNIVSSFKEKGLRDDEINVALTGTGLFEILAISNECINYEVEFNNQIYNLFIDANGIMHFDYNILKKNGSIIKERYNITPSYK